MPAKFEISITASEKYFFRNKDSVLSSSQHAILKIQKNTQLQSVNTDLNYHYRCSTAEETKIIVEMLNSVDDSEVLLTPINNTIRDFFDIVSTNAEAIKEQALYIASLYRESKHCQHYASDWVNKFDYVKIEVDVEDKSVHVVYYELPRGRGSYNEPHRHIFSLPFNDDFMSKERQIEIYSDWEDKISNELFEKAKNPKPLPSIVSYF
jgi:hypothetical protein